MRDSIRIYWGNISDVKCLKEISKTDIHLNLLITNLMAIIKYSLFCDLLF